MMFFTTHSHAHPRRTRRRLANIQNTQKVVLDFSLSASHHYGELNRKLRQKEEENGDGGREKYISFLL